MRIRHSLILLTALGLVPPFTRAAEAQSLRGSAESVDLMYERAVQEDLTFYRNATSVKQAVSRGELVRLAPNEDMTLGVVRYPYVRAATRDWVVGFAQRYHEQCRQRLVVTSGARPLSQQPRNGSPRSVHPTGMAVDLRKPTGACLRWLRTALLAEERDGVIEATEERRPPHFHVAVLIESEPEPIRVAETTSDESDDSSETRSHVVLASVATRPIEAEPVAKAPALSRYRVRSGDTLWDIARRNDTTVKRLRSINGLHSSTLRPGQVLLVPTS